MLVDRRVDRGQHRLGAGRWMARLRMLVAAHCEISKSRVVELSSIRLRPEQRGTDRSIGRLIAGLARRPALPSRRCAKVVTSIGFVK